MEIESISSSTGTWFIIRRNGVQREYYEPSRASRRRLAKIESEIMRDWRDTMGCMHRVKSVSFKETA